MPDPTPRSLKGSPLGSPEDVSSTGQAVRDMFAAVAPRYDFLNHVLSLGRDIAWRKAAAKSLRPCLEQPGSRVLDLCCGTGDLALALERYSLGSVLAADFCRPMLQQAYQKARRHAGAILFVEADALTLPFADASLDAVALAFGFRNLASYARGLREIRRLLKPGGVLAILEFSSVRWPVFGPAFRFYFHRVLPWLGTRVSGVSGPYQYLHDSASRFPDQESLARALREAGFRSVHYRDFTGGVAALHWAEKP
jgi:demethylmenaquinone methyltransferase/2-methoxy-6-polyprenyl-1,4-benzoquinol methylase